MNRLLVCYFCGLFVLLGCGTVPTQKTAEDTSASKETRVRQVAERFMKGNRPTDDWKDDIVKSYLEKNTPETECHMICEKDENACAEKKEGLNRPHWVVRYTPECVRDKKCEGGFFSVYIDDETERVICVWGAK
ncbi:MAG TPA: hypothetical protein PKH10_10035 [bacterium]|nr:hypothetical protein [bacterium]